MPKFEFDPEQSPAECVASFLDHLTGIDEELAEVLKAHLFELMPLPEPGPARNSQRQSTNAKIAAALDVLPEDLDPRQ